LLHETQKNDLNLKLQELPIITVHNSNSSSNNLPCYPPDSY